MRIVPNSMTRSWKDQGKTGDQRPTVRATIQKAQVHQFDYDTAWATGGTFDFDRHRKGTFTSILFGDASPVKEIRNIRSYTWTRSVDQDVATCQLTLLNTDLIPIGNSDEHQVDDDAFDMPGYFTYNRGQTSISANKWGYDDETGWTDMYVPDRLVKTYEGYSFDDNYRPEDDPHLMQSGTWLIDKVTYNTEGDIVLQMRDIGRLLLDQIVFPPVIPNEEYPLSWSKVFEQRVDSRDAQGGHWSGQRLKGTASSSNDKYIGRGLTNKPYKHYVGPDGSFQGHHARHVLENDPIDPDEDYQPNRWISTGQESKNSMVWWQVDLDTPANVAAVRVHQAGGPYRMFVSLKGPDGWYGRKEIPYEVTTEGVNIQADIPFVASAIADRTFAFDIILKRKYPDVRAVRITLTHLWDGKVGEYPWRAGLKDVRLYTGDISSLEFTKGTKLKIVGNYFDYTDIVKWIVAWGGWYWPPQGTDMDFMNTRGGADEDNRVFYHYLHHDNVLPKGRVWGDFMQSGTHGEADLTVDLFDKKPLSDVINYVRDILGFLFFVDETGGIIWRMPNIGLADNPKLGNYVSPGRHGQYNRTRTSDIVTIDDEETLIGYSTDLSSENLRERIFVANSLGKVGTVIKGPVPYYTGIRRVAGWTDQHFETKRETRVMADMIAARQMFEFRRGHIRIPGYPAIQIDDQIRVFERVTNETFYHYVMGITCTLDMESGEYLYEMDTHWLGERPSDAWVVKVNELDNATQVYLNTVGE